MERPSSAVPAHAPVEAAEVSYLATVNNVVIHQHAEEIGQLLANGHHSGMVLELDLPEKLGVIGDPDQLRQVFWNLVLNAAESEPSDDRIRISARSGSVDRGGGSGEVEVSVEDRGKGIAPQDLERIFEPFFTTRARGTGLGLATVHRVVEAHGGTIQLQSTQGQGTRVGVLLPEAPTGSIKGQTPAAD